MHGPLSAVSFVVRLMRKEGTHGPVLKESLNDCSSFNLT